MDQSLVLSKKIYLKYANLSLPRHTSYPTPPFWHPLENKDIPLEALVRAKGKKRELSIYVHIPFCHNACHYCGCNREIIAPHKATYLDTLKSFFNGIKKEVAFLSQQLNGLWVKQVHFGGGTPTSLPPSLLAALGGLLREGFKIASDAQISIELDPRTTTPEHLDVFAKIGINRASIGVQDFEPKVLWAINRQQPCEMVKDLTDSLRNIGVKSVNYDLIYGLPFQTPGSVKETLTKVITLEPDRIAFYRLALIPGLFKRQRYFCKLDMPSSEQNFEIMLMALTKLTGAGYTFIGFDHFAKAHDGLAKSLENGKIVRNFQGMGDSGGLDTIGIGPSAISKIGATYLQNDRSFSDWLEKLAELPPRC